jgi:hypothetical protein
MSGVFSCPKQSVTAYPSANSTCVGLGIFFEVVYRMIFAQDIPFVRRLLRNTVQRGMVSGLGEVGDFQPPGSAPMDAEKQCLINHLV